MPDKNVTSKPEVSTARFSTEARKAHSSIVEFSRNFGDNSDVYKDLIPSLPASGDLNYDCE